MGVCTNYLELVEDEIIMGWYLNTFDCFQHSGNFIRFYIYSLAKFIPTPHSLKNGDGLIN